MCLKEEIKKKRPAARTTKEKISFIKTMHLIPSRLSLNEMYFELLPHPVYPLDLAPSDYYLFADLKRMLQGRRFSSSEEMIAEIKVFFRVETNRIIKKGIEMLDWTECITLDGNSAKLC